MKRPISAALLLLPLAVSAFGSVDEPAKKWDVNAAPGPSKDVAINVDEGTWINVDLAPDGKEIAFDLFGDIYVMPGEGGEPKALMHDVAWQMQPRFSPDGKRIAFTSDQGGGDNVWVMKRDGPLAFSGAKRDWRRNPCDRPSGLT